MFGITGLIALGAAWMSIVVVAQTINGTSTGLVGEFCNDYFCVTTTYSSSISTLTYNLTSTTGGKTAWMAVGSGSRMAGSTMWLTWSNAGTVVLSERSVASGHNPPTIDEFPISTQNTTSSLVHASSSKFTSIWSVPAGTAPTSPLNLIWAYKSGTPPGSAQDSITTMHDQFGIVRVQLVDVQIGSDGRPTSPTETPIPVEVAPGKGLWNQRADTRRLIQAHAWMMIIAWALASPIAILIGRYGRGRFPWVLPHWILQSGVTTVFTIIGLILALVSLTRSQSEHFIHGHQIMGIVLIFLLVVQLALGWFIHHQFNPDRLKRPITNWIHMAFGISITVLSFATLYKGIRLYQGGKWTTVLYWVWMGILAVALVAGYALVPRQARMEREVAMKRREDLTMQKIRHASAMPGVDRQPGVSGGWSWHADNANGRDNAWRYPTTSNTNGQRNVI